MPRETDGGESKPHKLGEVTRRVWLQIWKIVVPGALLGGVFIIFGELSEPRTHVGAALLREVGTGFIVAGIAVFGYEYLRDVSGVIAAEEDFRKQIDLFEKINQREADKALRDDLLRALDDHQGLADALLRPIQHAGEIRSRHAEPDLLPGASCLDLLAEVTHASVARMAAALNSFHGSVARKDAAQGYEYWIPDPRFIAGKVLSLLLSTLGRGDHYKSVANVLFYKNTLMGMFQAAANDACNRGVIIQRLFNVSNFEDEPPSAERFEECKYILRAHFELQAKINAVHPDAYQIRFYGRKLDSLVHAQYNPGDCPHLHALPRAYFGLFCNRTLKSTLLFFAVEPKRAARAQLAFRDQSDPTETYFDQMWRLAETAPNPFESESFDKAWLDATCARLTAPAANRGAAAAG